MPSIPGKSSPNRHAKANASVNGKPKKPSLVELLGDQLAEEARQRTRRTKTTGLLGPVTKPMPIRRKHGPRVAETRRKVGNPLIPGPNDRPHPLARRRANRSQDCKSSESTLKTSKMRPRL